MQIVDLVLSIKSNRNFFEHQNYFKKHPQQIVELIQLVENKEAYPVEEYASWILSHVVKTQRIEVQKYYNQLIDILFENNNQSSRRNILNTIRYLNITDYRESQFIDLLISYIEDYNTKVAAQVNAIYILASFVIIYPELKTEVLEIIDLHLEKKTSSYAAAKRKFISLTRKI